MNKFKRAAAAVLASAMVLALTACDEETPAAGSNAGTSNAAAPDANANAVGTTPLVTTTYDTDPAVQEAVEGAAASLDNPDLKVDKRIKWMAWWDIDETTAAAELFKKAYGIPATGGDPSREGRIFEYINVAYGERYDKLATNRQAPVVAAPFSRSASFPPASALQGFPAWRHRRQNRLRPVPPGKKSRTAGRQ